MSKKTILLIDGENILHQSFHKFEKLKSTDGKPSGAIFGFPSVDLSFWKKTMT